MTGTSIGDRASVAVMRRALSAIVRRAADAMNETTGHDDLEALEAIAALAGEALDQGAAPGDLAELLGQDEDAMLDALLDQRARAFDGDLAAVALDAAALEQAIAYRARVLGGGLSMATGAAFDRIVDVLAIYRERVRDRLRRRLGGAEPPR